MKKIGIVGWTTGDNSWGVTKPYLEYFSQFGQVEILTPRKDIVADLDLLVLPGGMDTNPANYDEVPGFYTGSNDTFKEYFYRQNLPQYVNAKIPIFGICLGFQQINTFFGGKLVQNDSYSYSKTRFERVELLQFGEYVKQYQKFVGYRVNSLHHQGVIRPYLAPDLIALATSKESDNIELICHKTLPIIGVQWHPEELNCTLSNLLIHNLLMKG